jgi:hypothetical protein
MVINNTVTPATLAEYDLTANIVFVTSQFLHVTIQSFSHDAFWSTFLLKHPVKSSEEMMELLLDITRCHFSPKSTSWPGCTIKVTGTKVAVGGGPVEYDFVLPKGQTKIKDFDRVRGNWNWTHACLATTALFEEIFHRTAKAECEKIPGHVDGYTQFFSTLDGWTEADQTAAEQEFANWVKANGLKARDPATDMKVKAAARATITNRTADTAAYSFKNLLRKFVSAAEVAGDRISKA